MTLSKRTDEEAAREFAVAPRFPSATSEILDLTLEIRLVTVLYGGGARAGYPDEITPFRPSSVRGHLRYWWRATRGAEFASWEALRTRESQIWGDTDHKSPVRIRVDCPDSLKPARYSLRRYENVPEIRYALFPPFEAKLKDLDSNRLLEGGGFRLKLSIHKDRTDLQKDIDSALWAWLNFGGLGARTRRGAGALFCQQYAGWDPAKLSGDGELREWPALKGSTILWGTKRQPWLDCWRQIMRLYREFRQERIPPGRGKTQWPEPDEIRSIRLHREQPGPAGFPRGALGLPILFHFKDRGDPKDQNLNIEEPEGRMTSPVILRPFAVSPTEAVPMLLVLNSPAAPGLYLHQTGEKRIQVGFGERRAIEELIQFAAVRWETAAMRA